MKIVVNMETCESHGQCELTVPEIFRLDDAGKLHYTAEPNEQYYDDVREAVDACPTQSISLVED